MYKNILIATDGSELADKGVTEGLTLAVQLGAKVTFVSVTETLPSYGIVVAAEWAASPLAFQEYQDAAKQAASELLAKVKQKAQAAGVVAETLHVEDESPAKGIVEAATKNGSDLIVIASHGRRGVNRLLLGSQAAEVLAMSTVPVLVIK